MPGDVDGRGGACKNCTEAGVECRSVGKKVKFRDAGKRGEAVAFQTEQRWVGTSGKELEWKDETGRVAAGARRGLRELAPRVRTGELVDHVQTTQLRPQREARTYSPSSTAGGCAPSTVVANTSTTARSGSSFDHYHCPADDHPGVGRPQLSISLQEACLIRHFTAKLANSFDATDRDAHYALTLPQRALTSPVLLYAICTVSSRLLASRWYSSHPKPTIVCYDGYPLPELNEHSAIHYHNACLRLLMDFADIPVDEANAEARADALAATTMLRTYEQLDTSLTGLDAEVYQSVVSTVMSKHHDVSIYSLDNMDKTNRDSRGVLIAAEGLRTSACLVALRQEIWSVVMYRRPLRLPLADGMDYSSLGPTDDFTWANRVILWCADVLQFCFGSSGRVAKTRAVDSRINEMWRALMAFDERWIADTPSCFRPLFSSPPRPEQNHCFPVIWQLNNAHVVAIQHLHLGRMLLVLHDPTCHVASPSSVSNAADKHLVRELVKALCGLALSDKHFQAGMTTAAIGISIGGEFFEEMHERHAIVGFLETLEEEHAWPTKSMIDSLQGNWGVVLRPGRAGCHAARV